jgi:hypothetical protein
MTRFLAWCLESWLRASGGEITLGRHARHPNHDQPTQCHQEAAT